MYFTQMLSLSIFCLMFTFHRPIFVHYTHIHVSTLLELTPELIIQTNACSHNDEEISTCRIYTIYGIYNFLLLFYLFFWECSNNIMVLYQHFLSHICFSHSYCLLPVSVILLLCLRLSLFWGNSSTCICKKKKKSCTVYKLNVQ